MFVLVECSSSFSHSEFKAKPFQFHSYPNDKPNGCCISRQESKCALALDRCIKSHKIPPVEIFPWKWKGSKGGNAWLVAAGRDRSIYNDVHVTYMRPQVFSLFLNSNGWDEYGCHDDVNIPCCLSICFTLTTDSLSWELIENKSTQTL